MNVENIRVEYLDHLGVFAAPEEAHAAYAAFKKEHTCVSNM